MSWAVMAAVREPKPWAEPSAADRRTAAFCSPGSEPRLFREMTWLHVHPPAGNGLYFFWRRFPSSGHLLFKIKYGLWYRSIDAVSFLVNIGYDFGCGPQRVIQI